MSFKAFTKDADAKLNYQVDWTAWLATDTISVSTWVVPAGITNVATSNTTLLANITLSGGTTGQNYTVTNRITTAAGLINDKSLVIKIRDT